MSEKAHKPYTDEELDLILELLSKETPDDQIAIEIKRKPSQVVRIKDAIKIFLQTGIVHEEKEEERELKQKIIRALHRFFNL